jgi:hypothetical protein
VAALAAGNDIPASRVEAVLGLFGPYSSLGMAQRLGIAAALFGGPGYCCLMSRSTDWTPRASAGPGT